MKKILFFVFVALMGVACQSEDPHCLEQQNNYKEILELDDKIQEKVVLFDQNLGVDLSEDKNYLEMMAMKSQRDEKVRVLLSYKMQNPNCELGTDADLNQELNELL